MRNEVRRVHTRGCEEETRGGKRGRGRPGERNLHGVHPLPLSYIRTTQAQETKVERGLMRKLRIHDSKCHVTKLS